MNAKGETKGRYTTEMKEGEKPFFVPGFYVDSLEYRVSAVTVVIVLFAVCAAPNFPYF